MQVITVRISRGDWEHYVQVPFTQWIDQQAWSLGEVDIPGSDASVQLQLGNTKKSIPAMVQLDEFELVPYAGDFTAHLAATRINYSFTPRMFLSGLLQYNRGTDTFTYRVKQWKDRNQPSFSTKGTSQPPKNSVVVSAVLPNLARRSASAQNRQTTGFGARILAPPQPPLQRNRTSTATRSAHAHR